MKWICFRWWIQKQPAALISKITVRFGKEHTSIQKVKSVLLFSEHIQIFQIVQKPLRTDQNFSGRLKLLPNGSLFSGESNISPNTSKFFRMLIKNRPNTSIKFLEDQNRTDSEQINFFRNILCFIRTYLKFSSDQKLFPNR